jgi:secreted trypsin-like serine protease
VRQLLPLLALLACGDATGTTRSPIINGNADTTDTSVVAIIITPIDTSMGVEVCSGTVVSPHVVMTAAHCVDPAIVGTISDVSIFLGSDFTNVLQDNNPANFVETASRSFDSAFDPTNPVAGHDIAVVVANAPLSLTPLPINHDSLGSGDEGSPALAVGFGESDGSNMNSAGPRRSIMTTVLQVDDEHIVLDDVICEGDSGGPTFLTKDGVQVVAGVHSFTNAMNCVGTGDDTRVDLYASSFVDPAIDAADPGFLKGGGCNESGSRRTTSSIAVLLLALVLALASRVK